MAKTLDNFDRYSDGGPITNLGDTRCPYCGAANALPCPKCGAGMASERTGDKGVSRP